MAETGIPGNRDMAEWLEREALRVRRCEFGVVEEIVVVYRASTGGGLVHGNSHSSQTGFHAIGLLSWAKRLVLRRGGLDP